jgi:hypothetical protein
LVFLLSNEKREHRSSWVELVQRVQYRTQNYRTVLISRLQPQKYKNGSTRSNQDPNCNQDRQRALARLDPLAAGPAALGGGDIRLPRDVAGVQGVQQK